MVLFWMWGLSIDAAEFFRDHLQTHYLDRLTHHNPLGYGDYPSVAGLWKELWQHTGYVLLPLAAVTLILASLKDTTASATASSPEAEEGFVRLWLIWTLLAAVVFSLVDWRQTKHLMPLMLVFHLVPARWAGNRRRAVLLVAAAFALLAAWNVWTLSTLVYDFHSFPITPDW